jgi:hypothetical protein
MSACASPWPRPSHEAPPLRSCGVHVCTFGIREIAGIQPTPTTMCAESVRRQTLPLQCIALGKAIASGENESAHIKKIENRYLPAECA